MRTRVFPDPWVEAEKKFAKELRDRQAGVEAAAKSSTKEVQRTLPGTDSTLKTSFTVNQEAAADSSGDCCGGWWVKGENVNYFRTAAETRSSLISLLAEFGFLRAKLETEIVRDPGAGTATLLVKILEEGGVAQTATVSVQGHRWNTREAILTFVGVAPGQPWSRERQRAIRRHLWDSGRFINFALTAQRHGQDDAVDVTLTVEEWWQAPPAGTELTRTQSAFLRWVKWFTEETNRDDLLCEIAGPDGFTVKAALAWGKGLAVEANGGKIFAGRAALQISHKKVLAQFEQDGQAWILTSGGVKSFPGRAFLHLLSRPEGEGDAGGEVEMGAGASTQSGKYPGLSFIVQPQLVLQTMMEQMAEDTFAITDGVVRVTKAGGWWEFDEASGRFLRGEALIPDGWKVVLRSAPGAYAALAAVIDRTPPEEKSVHSLDLASTIGWFPPLALLATADLSSLSHLKPEVQQRAWHAWQAIITALSAAQKDDGDLGFEIPSTMEEIMANKNPVMVMAGVAVLGTAESFLPPDSWATRLGRELVFLAAGRTEHAGETLTELLRDSKMGPFGCLGCAMTLRMLSLNGSDAFARRGLSLLTKEDFRNDWQPLVEGGTGMAVKMQQLTAALAARPPEEVEALAQVATAAWGDEPGLTVRGLFLALKGSGDRPPAEMVAPAMDAAFVLLIGELLKSQFEAIAAPAEAADPATVAAVVNGRQITREQVSAAAVLSQITESEMLPKLIEEEVMVQKLESQNIVPKQEKVMELLEQYGQTHGGGEEYLKLMTQRGVSPPMVGWRLGRQAVLTEGASFLAAGSKPVTESELDAAVVKELPKASEEIHLSTITVSPGDKLTPEEAEKLTREIHQKLKEGADFGELATESSSDAAAANKGDRGWIARGMLSAGFADKAFALKTGEISEVTGLDGDWFIFRVTERRQGKAPAAAEFRQKLRQRLDGQRRVDATTALVKTLQASAKIELLAKSAAPPPAADASAIDNKSVPAAPEFAGAPSELGSLRERAEKGDARARVILAAVLAEADSTAAALLWAQRAAGAGDPLGKAMVDILTIEDRALDSETLGLEMFVETYDGMKDGLLQMLGMTPSDLPAEPADELQRAADAGDAWACYLKGLLDQKSQSLAVRGNANDWLKKAADAGVAPAIRRYSSSLGSAESMEKTIADYKERAAAKGIRSAELAMATIRQMGRGAPKDVRQAAQDFQRLAESGDPDAAWEFGTCHERGLGMNRNFKEAVKWYEFAAFAGQEDAARRLRALREWGLIGTASSVPAALPDGVPVSFDVRHSGKLQPGWHHWMRHGQLWTELQPDGTRQAWLTTGRETLGGVSGTVAVFMEPGVTAAVEAGAKRGVFIPDKPAEKESETRLLIRERSDTAGAWSDWNSPGVLTECR